MRLLVSILILVCLSAAPAPAEPGDTAHLAISFDSRCITVICNLPPVSGDSVVLTLSEWAGVPDYDRNIYRLIAMRSDFEQLEVKKIGANRWVVNHGGRAFTYQYLVVNQRESFVGNGRHGHFYPALFEDYVFAWGDSYVIAPELDDDSLPVVVTVEGGPYGEIACNRDLAQPLGSFGELCETVLIGGDYAHSTERLFGTSVELYIRGENWAFRREEFFGAVTEILQSQATAFGSYPAERMMIVLNEGSARSSGGTVIENAIALFADPAAGLFDHDAKTLQLIAHENAHVWNGNAIHPVAREEIGEGYHKWFQEGVTDYYAWLTLYRTGVLDDSGFVVAINRLLVDYWTNPRAMSATLDTLEQKYWSDEQYRQLPYRKGAITALLIDLTIREESDGVYGLDSLMRALLADSAIQRDGYDDSTIQRHLEQLTHNDWSGFFNAYVRAAAALPIDSVGAVAGVTVKMVTVPSYELGFAMADIENSRAKLVENIRRGSAADSAGLVESDTLVGWSFNRGDTENEAVFTVRRDGVESDIAFVPVRRFALPQLVADSLSIARLARLR